MLHVLIGAFLTCLAFLTLFVPYRSFFTLRTRYPDATIFGAGTASAKTRDEGGVRGGETRAASSQEDVKKVVGEFTAAGISDDLGMDDDEDESNSSDDGSVTGQHDLNKPDAEQKPHPAGRPRVVSETPDVIVANLKHLGHKEPDIENAMRICPRSTQEAHAIIKYKRGEKVEPDDMARVSFVAEGLNRTCTFCLV
jgi:hypothetical protein